MELQIHDGQVSEENKKDQIPVTTQRERLEDENIRGDHVSYLGNSPASKA